MVVRIDMDVIGGSAIFDNMVKVQGHMSLYLLYTGVSVWFKSIILYFSSLYGIGFIGAPRSAFRYF